MDITKLQEQLQNFADERDWNQFHSPKNLAMALSVEVAELMEHFQWLTEKESSALPEDTLLAVSQEVADIQIYLVRLADKLGVDIETAVSEKLGQNSQKYPAEQVRGSAKKYTHYSHK